MTFSSKVFVALMLLFPIVNTAIAQTGRPVSVYATGGVKVSNFEQVGSGITVVYPSPGYDVSWLKSKIDNTMSFFTGIYTAKPLNKRFTVSNELVLDMLQLDIRSNVPIRGTTAYTDTLHTDLLARLKLAFGLHYNLVAHKDNRLSFGLLAGQMIALSGKTNSYSLVGATLRFEHKQHAVFISGTSTPYDVKIKNPENYLVSFNSQPALAHYYHRIHEFNIGYAIRL